MFAQLESTAEIDAVERPLKMSSAQVARELATIFGAKLVVVMGHVGSTRAVRHWIEGAKVPDEIDRLRLALQVANVIRITGDGDAVAAAWFRGMNVRLGDRSPAVVIADDPLEQAQARVMAAARAFVAS